MTAAYPLDDSPKGFKEYFVLLSQEDTDAPTVERQIANDFTTAPVLSYSEIGTYRFTLEGAFPEDRTTIQLSAPRNTGTSYIAYQLTDDIVELVSGVLKLGDGEAPNFVDPPYIEVERMDDLLSNFGVRIIVAD